MTVSRNNNEVRSTSSSLMGSAYYMEFIPGHHGALDRIGGLPTHLPEAIPVCPNSGQRMAFLAQFYASPDRFNIPGALCIQLYQCLGIDEGEDPIPKAVLVPLGAADNEAASGVSQPSVKQYDIRWIKKEEPDESALSAGLSSERLQLSQSKAEGLAPHEIRGGPYKFLGQLAESPAGRNFGGYLAVLYLAEAGEIRVELV